MSKRKLIRLMTGVSLLVGLGGALPASASVLLEFDYRTAPVGTAPPVQTASASVASNQARFVDTNGNGTGAYPVVTTGTALGPGYEPAIADGYATFQGSISASAQGMVTLNTAGVGNNNYWVNYFGSGQGMGTGSAIVVFKPGESYTHNLRGTFVSSGIGAYGNFKLHDDSGNQGPRLDIAGVSINLGNTGAWDPTKWYVLTASWKSGSSAYLYLQSLSPTGSLLSVSSGATIVPTVIETSDGYVSHPIAFNAPSSDTGYPGGEETFPFFTSSGLSNSFSGSVALYRITNDYLDSDAKFSAMFNALIVPVPEPGSIALLAMAIPVLLRRSRKMHS